MREHEETCQKYSKTSNKNPKKEQKQDGKLPEFPTAASEELKAGNCWTFFCYEKKNFFPRTVLDDYRFDKDGNPYLYQKGYTTGDTFVENCFRIRCNNCN